MKLFFEKRKESPSFFT